MKEIRDIIRSYDEAARQGKRTALATVVHVEGSSYRKPGARMLITEDGQLTGAISGGCLEGDALRKALHVMNEQRTALVTYDTMDDDDATIGVGLGCNGIIQILIEPIRPGDSPNPIELLRSANAQRQPCVIVTLFCLANRRGMQPGTSFLLTPEGASFGKLPFPHLQEQVETDGNHVLEHRQSLWIYYPVTEEAGLTAFVEFLPPAVSLVIVGAGNDVMPLVEMADILGWEAWVADGRSTHARPERFARACQVLVAKPEQVLPQVPLDDWTAFALMTHNYNYDKAMLQELLRKNARYVAMLGPRKKLARMLDELREEGAIFTEGQLAALHSPAGLDIGALTPEEIALSIVAEVKAQLSGRSGRPLRVAGA